MWRPERCGVLVLLLGLSGCQQQMARQPKELTLASSDFFPDGRAARPLVAGTVPRGVPLDQAFATGLSRGEPVAVLPIKVDARVIARGRERYGIFCAPCHGLSGEGDGPVVQAGFTPPPSLRDPRLRAMPVGRMVQVMTLGYGAMLPYASRVPPADRWAIAAFIRVLQAEPEKARR